MFGLGNFFPPSPFDPQMYMIQAPPEREWEVSGCLGMQRHKGTEALVNAAGCLEIRSWGSGLVAAYSAGSYSSVVLVTPPSPSP